MKAKGEIATWMHLFQLNCAGSRGHSAEIIVNVALRGSQADKHPRVLLGCHLITTPVLDCTSEMINRLILRHS